jgi:hypothetical protein
VIGVDMNADYEDALLRLLAGESDLLIMEAEAARTEIQAELETGNPNTSFYREYAAAAVRLNPAHLPDESVAALLNDSVPDGLESGSGREVGESPAPAWVSDVHAEAEEDEEDMASEPATPEEVAAQALAADHARDAEDWSEAAESFATAHAHEEAMDAAPADEDAAVAMDEDADEHGDEVGDEDIAPDAFFRVAADKDPPPLKVDPADEATVADLIATDDPSATDDGTFPPEDDFAPAEGDTIAMEGAMSIGDSLMHDETEMTPPVDETEDDQATAAPDIEEIIEMSDAIAEPTSEETAEDGSRCESCCASLPERENLNFCPFCGSDLRVVPCGSCGELLEHGWRFCVACGAESEAAQED